MGLMRQILLHRVTEQHNDSPARALRPFDVQATGTVVGEGAGLFILEEYEHAKARGAKMYAELAGFGASQDTYKITDPSPDGSSYSRAIGKALQDANLPPAAVDLLVPCGLGLPAHDRAELNALTTVFGGGLSRIPMTTIKPRTGNTAAGSGIDAAAALLSMHHGKIPAALNTNKIQSDRQLNLVPEPRDATINTAVSSVYSLGGQNAALVFRRLD
jgi:3-oxoacyl-[acyl-carrier-protein] synthase II